MKKPSSQNLEPDIKKPLDDNPLPSFRKLHQMILSLKHSNSVESNMSYTLSNQSLGKLNNNSEQFIIREKSAERSNASYDPLNYLYSSKGESSKKKFQNMYHSSNGVQNRSKSGEKQTYNSLDNIHHHNNNLIETSKKKIDSKMQLTARRGKRSDQKSNQLKQSEEKSIAKKKKRQFSNNQQSKENIPPPFVGTYNDQRKEDETRNNSNQKLQSHLKSLKNKPDFQKVERERSTSNENKSVKMQKENKGNSNKIQLQKKFYGSVGESLIPSIYNVKQLLTERQHLFQEQDREFSSEGIKQVGSNSSSSLSLLDEILLDNKMQLGQNIDKMSSNSNLSTREDINSYFPNNSIRSQNKRESINCMKKFQDDSRDSELLLSDTVTRAKYLSNEIQNQFKSTSEGTFELKNIVRDLVEENVRLRCSIQQKEEEWSEGLSLRETSKSRIKELEELISMLKEKNFYLQQQVKEGELKVVQKKEEIKAGQAIEKQKVKDLIEVYRSKQQVEQIKSMKEMEGIKIQANENYLKIEREYQKQRETIEEMKKVIEEKNGKVREINNRNIFLIQQLEQKDKEINSQKVESAHFQLQIQEQDSEMNSLKNLIKSSEESNQKNLSSLIDSKLFMQLQKQTFNELSVIFQQFQQVTECLILGTEPNVDVLVGHRRKKKSFMEMKRKENSVEKYQNEKLIQKIHSEIEYFSEGLSSCSSKSVQFIEQLKVSLDKMVDWFINKHGMQLI